MKRQFISALCLIIMLTACTGGALQQKSEKSNNKKSMNELALFNKPLKIDTKISPIESQNRAIKYYQTYLDMTDNSHRKIDAIRRLADLKLEKYEERIAVNQDAETSPYQAIKHYESLIKNNPDYEHIDSALYQLARAYDLSGELIKSLQILLKLIENQPDSPYTAEAYFRLGDTLFTLERYQEAAHAYQKIIQKGQPSIFYEKALYKHGWSEFKWGQYQSAQKSFIKLLDIILFDTDTSLLWSIASLEKDADRKLVDDIFQVLTFSFSYQNGASSVNDFFSRQGRRDYEFRIYSLLGEHYLKQGKTAQAARTYDAFIQQSPYSIHTPHFFAKKVEVYRQAGLSNKLLDAKVDFITRYDINSDYWTDRNQSARHQIMDDLKSNTEDVAQHYHAIAQKNNSSEAYRQATHWYQLFIRNFPNDSKTPSVNFLLAELLFESKRYADAIKEYEKTAYDYPTHKNSADAGYAALIAQKHYKKSLGYQQKLQWESEAALSSLRFSETFPQDPRTTQITIKAIEQLYASGEYGNAINAAQKIIDTSTSLKPELKQIVLTVIAHSQFEMKNYTDAEATYKKALAQLPAESIQNRQKLDERLAATIYKQGEIQHKQQKYHNAIKHYLRIERITPNATSIIATATFDVAASYIALKDWKNAIRILEVFRRSYPNHPLQNEVPSKLAVAYMEGGHPLKAAKEFSDIIKKGGTVEREALWLTADLYQKNGKKQDAISIYERYITLYPDPFEQAIEAHNRIAVLYSHGENPLAHQSWLKKIIEADKNAGKKRTDRTRYIASQAALTLAKSTLSSYQRIKLVAPLKDNLHKKKRYMQSSLSAYTQITNYAIADSTTAATYNIANIYYDFSQALLKSERPQELNAEELEQYDILLEEQAFPFEEKAIETHIQNTRRTRQGVYNQWIEKSFSALQILMPARYKKVEHNETAIDRLH
ncbi:MAG: tetratricopeptide repeat protein [Gammaproteobacteria bacterium]|nr:tetratricopeptide repeat protein [Gammaproteobacteria bacterium]